MAFERRSMRSPAHVWIHFVSHNLGPRAAVMSADRDVLSSFRLPGVCTCRTARDVFYGLAMLDRWVPEGSAVKHISLMRTVTVLMAAALSAPFALLHSADRVWKQIEVGKPHIRAVVRATPVVRLRRGFHLNTFPCILKSAASGSLPIGCDDGGDLMSQGKPSWPFI